MNTFKLIGLFGLVGLLGLMGSGGLVRVHAAGTEPWHPSETLAPSELAAMLAKGSKPSIVYVGPRALFRTGQIPEAIFHGPASEPDALSELKHWAASLPRSGLLVIYCGCCPLEKCPNIRPAFSALRSLGMTNVRVLVLETSFEKDWVAKNYQVDRAGQAGSEPR